MHPILFHLLLNPLYLSIQITKDTIKPMGTPNERIQRPEEPPSREPSLAQSTHGQVPEYQDQKCWHKYQIRTKNPKIQLYPYNCIGMLAWKNTSKNNREEIGTGFLVDQSLILTALHNAVNNFGNLHENMQFYPKRNCAMNSLHTTSEFAKVIGIKKSDSSLKKIGNPAEDYCLLLLEKPIKREQYIKLGFDYSLTQNLNAEIYGYPHELIIKSNEFSQFGTKGRIDSIQQGVIYYEIATSEGESGSPLLVETSDQQKIAVGVHNKACNSRQKNCASQLSYKKIELIHRWAYELTGKASRIQVVNCQRIKFETNPLAEQERKSHEYSFITQVHNFITRPINPEQEQKSSSSIKKSSSIRSDLWATIKTGTFQTKTYPYNCIGLIIATYTDSRNQVCKHYGTGFLINSRVVFTSIYNLIKFQDTYSFEFQDIVFYPGLHGDINEEQNLQRKRKVIGKRYNIPRIKPSNLKETVDTSLAVLLLDNPVDKKRYIMIGEDYDEQDKVYLFGYGWNELNRTNFNEFTNFKQRGSEGKVKQVKENTIFHSAYSQNGSQGSPILVQYVTGQFFIIGIHIVSKRKGNKEEKCMALLMTPKRVRMVNEWIKQLRQKRPIQSYNLKESQSLKIRLPTLKFSYLEQYNRYAQLIFKKDNGNKSETLTNLAYQSHMIGKFQQSNYYLMQEIDLSQNESFFRQSANNQIYYFNLMGVNNLYLRNYQNAESNFKQAENIIRGQHDNISQKEIAIVLNNIGVLYVKKGNMDEAFNYFKQAILKINKKDKVFLSIYNNNNSCYHKLKKIKQNQVHNTLIESFNFLSEPTSPDQMISTSIVAYNLSISYLAEANYKEVIEYLEVYVRIITLLGLTQNPQYIDNIKWIETLVESIIKSNIIDRKIILKAVKLFKKVVRIDEKSQLLLKELMNIILPLDEQQRKHRQKS